MTGKIKIKNQADKTATIDIEGTIGVNEEWQFENSENKITTYEKFSQAIEEINNQNIENIVVNIKSIGGNVNEAILIYETLIQANKNITTKCFGYVASAATIIAQAASKNQREISGNALYLIHKAMCETEGNAIEINRSVEMLAKTDKTIAQIYAKRAGRKQEVFEKLMGENNGAGRWLEPKEVIEYGLADKIIEPVPIEKNMAKIVSNLGLPPIPENIDLNKKKIMAISKHWKSILGLIGLSEEKGGNKKKHYNKENDIDIPEYQRQIESLKNRITTLETENARLAAKPTMTKPKEDPAINDIKQSPNLQAYINDIQNFK